MVYVALAEAIVLLAVTSIFAGLLRSAIRSSARREDLLLDKLLHAVGQPWTPPPADEYEPPPLVDRIDWSADNPLPGGAYERFTLTPESEA